MNLGKSLKRLFYFAIIFSIGTSVYYMYANKDEFEKMASELQKEYENRDIISSVEEVPNQREINNVWVSNPHQILSFYEVNQIDSVVKKIEETTNYEIAVVVLSEIENAEPFDFGLELFNLWGIGKKEYNNGLLIMVLTDQRNLTFVTGSGTELVLTDLMTKKIGDEQMKPYFKEGNYAQGLLKGISVIGQIFENKETPYNYTRPPKYIWWFKFIFIIYFSLDLILIIVYLVYIIFIVFKLKDPYDKHNLQLKLNKSFVAYLFPIPFIILYFLNKVLVKKWRNYPRFSSKNGQLMTKITGDKRLTILS